MRNQDSPNTSYDGPDAPRVISFQRFRLARDLGRLGAAQGALASAMRAAVADREVVADRLREASHHLRGVSSMYGHLLKRLERERRFRDACRQALELTDLDEMIKRRDILARELAGMRRQDGVRLAVVGA